MADEDIETPAEAPEVDHAAENAALRRELAFTKAGIDTTKGPGALLFKSYDGEASEEAVKAAALEYGVISDTPEVPGPTISADEAEATTLRRDLTTGAVPDDGSEDPRIAAVNTGFESMKTKTREDAMVDAIRTLATAGVKGDPRVRVGAGD